MCCSAHYSKSTRWPLSWDVAGAGWGRVSQRTRGVVERGHPLEEKTAAAVGRAVVPDHQPGQERGDADRPVRQKDGGGGVVPRRQGRAVRARAGPDPGADVGAARPADPDPGAGDHPADRAGVTDSGSVPAGGVVQQ